MSGEVEDWQWPPDKQTVIEWTPDVVGRLTPDMISGMFAHLTAAIPLSVISALSDEQADALRELYLTPEQRKCLVVRASEQKKQRSPGHGAPNLGRDALFFPRGHGFLPGIMD